MSLSKENMAAIVATSALAVITLAVGGAAIVSKNNYGTSNLPKAMSLTRQFNNFAKSDYGKTPEQNLIFSQVRQFINDPRNNVLIATHKCGVYMFECLSKEYYSKYKQNKDCVLNYDAVELYLKMVKEKEEQPAAEEATLKDAKAKATAEVDAAAIEIEKANAEEKEEAAKTPAAPPAPPAPPAPSAPSAPPAVANSQHHQQQNKQKPLVPAVANNNAVKRTLVSDVGLATIAQRLKTYVQSRGVLNGVINDIERMFESTGQNVYPQQILERASNLKRVLEKNSTMSDNELKPLIEEPIKELQDALKKATQGGYNLKK